ncbi:MAG TPA: EamA family transporter [Candidatus Eisenbacteria bacterium]|nr:EamA family transporter [Candidatus Eisenbacteria bacterium]
MSQARTATQTETRDASTYAAFVGMCVIWGSTFLAIRIGNEAVAPVWGAFLRLVIATILYVLIARLVRAPWPRGAGLRAVMGYGLLNYGVNFVLLYWGELRVPSGTAAVFYATIPLTTGIFAAAMGVHAFERRQMVGALIGFLGVVLIFSGELSAGGPSVALGAVFIAATVASLSGVVLKSGPPQSTWVSNGIGAAVGAVVCLIASFGFGERHDLPHGLPGWGPILYLVVAGNLGAYALYGWLVTKWKITTVNAITLIIPVIAVILGALIRGEAPPPATYAGAGLVLAGVAITLFAKRR